MANPESNIGNQPDDLAAIAARVERLGQMVEEIRAALGRAGKDRQEDPQMAAARARMVLELVVKDVYRRCHAKLTKPKPINQTKLWEMIDALERGGCLPENCASYAHTVRKLGNMALHVRDDTEEAQPGTKLQNVSMRDAYYSLTALLSVLEWYFQAEQAEGHDEIIRALAAAAGLARPAWIRWTPWLDPATGQTLQWLLVAGVFGLVFWLLHIGIGLGPPWPDAPSLCAALSTLTALAVLATSRPARRSRHRLPSRSRWLLALVAASVVSYWGMFAFFAHQAGDWRHWIAGGCKFRPLVAEILEQSDSPAYDPTATVDSLLEDRGYNALVVWEPWSVYTVRLVMLALWLAMIASTAWFFGSYLPARSNG